MISETQKRAALIHLRNQAEDALRAMGVTV